MQLETSYASTCADAAAILCNESMDILLLDPDLPDHQGAEAFRLWTGREAPLDAMREAIGDDSCCAS